MSSTNEDIKPNKPRKKRQPKKDQNYSKLSSQGSAIMKRAHEIRAAEPEKTWHDCVSLAGKELKGKTLNKTNQEKNNL
jgi:hypothetical protein